MESFLPSLLRGPIVRDSFEGFFKRGFLLLAGGRELARRRLFVERAQY
jgi:hypothetical protein